MIAMAASEVVEALTDVQNGTFSSMACPVTINEGEAGLFPRFCRRALT